MCDVDFVGLAGNVTNVFDDVDEVGLVDDRENGFLDGVFDGLELGLDCFLQILRFLTEGVKHEHIVFGLESRFLFEPLHLVNNFSCEPLDFQLLVLSTVEQDDHLVSSDCLVLQEVVVVKLFADDQILFGR